MPAHRVHSIKSIVQLKVAGTPRRRNVWPHPEAYFPLRVRQPYPPAWPTLPGDAAPSPGRPLHALRGRPRTRHALLLPGRPDRPDSLVFPQLSSRIRAVELALETVGIHAGTKALAHRHIGPDISEPMRIAHIGQGTGSRSMSAKSNVT